MESLKRQHLSHIRDALRVHGHRSKRRCLQDFFLGPLFPAIVVATTKALPAYLHVFAIGFAAGVGGRGSAALPFVIGSLAQAKGVGVLQPVFLAVLTSLLVLWVCFPKLGKKSVEGDGSPSRESGSILISISSRSCDALLGWLGVGC
jgi:hypothetical protein